MSPFSIVALIFGLLWLGSYLYDHQKKELSAAEWPTVATLEADPLFQINTANENIVPDIKVHLVNASQKTSIDLELIGNFRLLSQKGELLRKGHDLHQTLKLDPDGIHIGAWHITANPVFIETSGDAGIRIDNRTYRGKLAIEFLTGKNKLPEKLKLSLFVPLEDYVAGVVCGEMPSNTPGIAAALRAQAIAARTYALWKRGQGVSELRDDTADQHFESVDFETEAARKAVLDTQALVLSWNNKLLPAWYHADCGGASSNAKDSGFGRLDLPPLKGSRDQSCDSSPTWERVIDAKRLDDFARHHGLGEWIDRIQISSRDRGGRLIKLRIDGELDSTEVLGERLRSAFGLPSMNWISMQALADGGLLIRGKGNGHGVGLCQTGSMKLSKSDYETKDILQHYYPGSQTVDFLQLQFKE